METNTILASRSSRFLAFLVDIFISFLFTVIISFSTGIANPSSFYNPSAVDHFHFSDFLVSIICIIIFYILIPTYIWKGQTLGKRWLSIAVVTEDDQEVNLMTMILRSIFSLLGGLKVPVLSIIIGFIAFIDPFFIFNAKRKTLHDLIANTKVIDV